MKKVLTLGSGALKIGEAGEFDYSGSQAIKALKEEGIGTVLVNPNIATIQTSQHFADRVYFLPIQEYFIEKIIAKEKPDSILLSFGGQTALNCGLGLYEKGILEKYNVAVLGTPVKAIQLSEDRKKFATHLRSMNIPTPHSETAKTIQEGIAIARSIGYPVMIRSGFALGGQGSGIAANEKQLRTMLELAFAYVSQVLVERYLHHYKEIEYEVVRDQYDNCITVCNMENMDPLGIHTGESIVIAPSQTLTNMEYHTLRSEAIRIVRSLGVIGECNVQFAQNPRPTHPSLHEYYVIEMNARLSRSSALASKATGYPLAYVAAKLALGKSLTELQNTVTKATQFCFEPALDYVTVKIPRWDINKFKFAENTIGSSMKSVGEVMGIGRTFEEAYQKAIRMLELDFDGAVNEKLFDHKRLSKKQILEQLRKPTPNRIFAIAAALYKNIDVEKIWEITGIDPWFIFRIKNIVDEETKLQMTKLIQSNKHEQLLSLKQLGFSDKRISQLVSKKEDDIRVLRKKLHIIPSVFQIDTLAGEFPARTNYLYLTYNGSHNDVTSLSKSSVIVLGSGPYRIGSSVEFDWTCVQTVIALKKRRKPSIVINCNPETVSTDYDISDRLYFEELTFERIADIYDFEQPYGIILSVGGQTPNNRAQALYHYKCHILGTSPVDIDRAEDRNKFSTLLDRLAIKQPDWQRFSKLSDALSVTQKTGFPVLIRPSYVLSGSGMKICHNEEDLIAYLSQTATISTEHPVTVSKFIENAKEIEVDCLGANGVLKALLISEHVENGGVHSGDATIVMPPQKLYVETYRKIKRIATDIAAALHITGPFNMQCLAKNNEVFIIEVNVRSSRTLPFVSKVMGVDLMQMAVDAYFDKPVTPVSFNFFERDYVATKMAQFSFARLTGADPVLDVEMTSTGEVACFGNSLEGAFLKSALSVGAVIPKKGIFISLGGEKNKIECLESIKALTKLQLPLYATQKTASFLKKHDITVKRLYKIHEKKSPNVLRYFTDKKIDLAINITDSYIKKEINDDYIIRRAAVDHNITLFTNMQKAELFIKAITMHTIDDLLIKAWDEYMVK